jgi:hypothetical protein
MGLVGSFLDVESDVAKIAVAPVEITADLARVATKPVADIAGEVVDEVKLATKNIADN